MKLKEWLPQEAVSNPRLKKYLDRKIIKKLDSLNIIIPQSWPGRHKNVKEWVEIDGGIAVGWNKNPNRGWAFPVKKVPKIHDVLEMTMLVHCPDDNLSIELTLKKRNLEFDNGEFYFKYHCPVCNENHKHKLI